MRAASTDKDARLSVHPGAKTFYDGEEKTLIERYGDWLFYGPMLLPALGSVLAAILRFLGFPRSPEAPPILSRTQEIIASIEAARSLAELDAIRGTIDAAVTGLMNRAARAEIDAQLTAVIHLAVTYVDRILAERRELLLYEGRRDRAKRGLERLAHLPVLPRAVAANEESVQPGAGYRLRASSHKCLP